MGFSQHAKLIHMQVKRALEAELDQAASPANGSSWTQGNPPMHQSNGGHVEGMPTRHGYGMAGANGHSQHMIGGVPGMNGSHPYDPAHGQHKDYAQQHLNGDANGAALVYAEAGWNPKSTLLGTSGGHRQYIHAAAFGIGALVLYGAGLGTEVAHSVASSPSSMHLLLPLAIKGGCLVVPRVSSAATFILPMS